MNPAQSIPTAQAPAPTADESFERYTIRAHKALMSSIPDPDERNNAVWSTWDKVRGQRPEEAIALSKFSADRFELSNEHCVFAEHETVASDGSPRKYGLGELAKIVRQHSKEQRDIGMFPALTSCHTPDKSDPNAKDPDVLGYSGLNPRLGMIGTENPRWAIFTDEAHLHESKVELAKKPFRSVELWTFRDGKMRFHPVAAVGAEAPRLQMPAKYTTRFLPTDELGEAGVVVEKYTYTAAFPGGSNTFVKEPVKYSANGDNPMAADISEIMAAIAETPEFQFLRTLQAEYEAEKAAAANPGAGMPPAADPNAPPAGAPVGPAAPAAVPPAAAQPADDLADLQDLLGPDDSPKPDAPPPADKPPEKNTVAHNPNVVSVEKYNALHGIVAKQSERLVQLERVATDANRRQKLNELAGKFPGIIDVEEEGKLCLYSLGSQMSDAQFNDRIGTVEKYAQRFEDSAMIPRGELPERYVAQTSVEKYEQRLAEEMVKVHGEIVRRTGRHANPDECEAEAKKRLGEPK